MTNLSYEEKKKAVLSQYFDQYLDKIYPAIELYNELAQKRKDGILNVMHTMFLCSVIDHFGKIIRVADLGNSLPLKNGQTGENFIFFINNYFPSDNCKGDIIYKLFRNGVMHQFFPKASGVFWSDHPMHKNILLDNDNGNPRLNNYTFSTYIDKALKYIEERLNGDHLKKHICNMYDNLILKNYGFDDYKELEKLKKKYSSNKKTFNDPC